MICSSLTEAGAETTLQALEAGAVSIITKPTTGLTEFLRDYEEEFINAVREASVARLGNIRSMMRSMPRSGQQVRHARRLLPATGPTSREKLTADAILPPSSGRSAMARTTDQFVAIGTSTGGTPGP